MKHLNDSEPSTTSPLMEGTPTIKSHRKLLQIIDTTLLQCYLHVSPRQPEGHYIHHSQNTQHHLCLCYMTSLYLRVYIDQRSRHTLIQINLTLP